MASDTAALQGQEQAKKPDANQSDVKKYGSTKPCCPLWGAAHRNGIAKTPVRIYHLTSIIYYYEDMNVRKKYRLRTGILVLCAVVACGVGLLIGVVSWRNKGTAVHTGLVLTQANERRLESAVASGDVKQQVGVLSAEIRNEFMAQGHPLLPKRAVLDIRIDTFRSDTDIAQAEATVDGKTYTIHFVLENNQWQILYTEQHS